MPQTREPAPQGEDRTPTGTTVLAATSRRQRPRRPAFAAQRSREADAAGVTGVVVLEIRIDETGGVSDAKVVRSIPMLDEAALATVKQWRYAPTLIEGRAVPVKMIVSVNFAPPRSNSLQLHPPSLASEAA